MVIWSNVKVLGDTLAKSVNVEHFALSENDTRLDYTASVTDPM